MESNIVCCASTELVERNANNINKILIMNPLYNTFYLNTTMKPLIILFISIMLVSCADQGLPTAGTMETGETIKNPRQYDEFCERDVDDLCPEDE